MRRIAAIALRSHFSDQVFDIQLLRLATTTGFLGLLNFRLDGGEFLLVRAEFNQSVLKAHA
jgi:hypothetical protein